MTTTPDAPADGALIAAALAAFQAEMPTVHKGKTATIPGKEGRSGYSYKYADLADVAQAAHPLLSKHGLSFTAQPSHHDALGQVLRGTLLHESGERMTGMLPINGRDPQSLGSAITYARRYLLGCMTGIVTDDDDDAGAAMAAPVPAQARPDPVAAYTAAVKATDAGDAAELRAVLDSVRSLGIEHYVIPGGAMQGKKLGEVIAGWLAEVSPDPEADVEPQWCDVEGCPRPLGHDGEHGPETVPAFCSGKRREDGALCSKPVGHTGPHAYDRPAADA